MADQPSSSSSNQSLIPNLPNDVALQCIARVHRSHHPHMSLVSKQWRSTLQSATLHSTRRTLFATQSFLFLNLRHFNPLTSFFSSKCYFLDSSQNTPYPYPYPPHLFPIQPCPSPWDSASCVASDHFVYVIGGLIRNIPSNGVWVYDCMRNKWELGPKMSVARQSAASGVVDGKIYVLGGCSGDNWAEMFDPITRVWATVKSPIDVRWKPVCGSAVMGGRIYGASMMGGVVFEPGTEKWGAMELKLGWCMGVVVVDEVLYDLYSHDCSPKLIWFDAGDNVWRELRLRGVNDSDSDSDSKECPPNFLCGVVKMANVGGRLFVLWEANNGTRNGTDIEIWCAEIEIEIRKNDSGDLWGSVVWSRLIIVIPKGSYIVHCLGVQI